MVRAQSGGDAFDRFTRNVLHFAAFPADGVMVVRLVADDICGFATIVDPRARFTLAGQQIQRSVNG